MFTSVLVANRGEIACRIIGTLRRLRHPRDRRLVGCRQAGAPRRARGPGDAHRPAAGHGKLPSHRCDHRGCGMRRRRGDPSGLWLPLREPGVRPRLRARRASPSSGRPPEVIEAMGAKDRAKALMAEAGVPLVPGLRRRQPGRRRAPRGGAGTGLPGADQGRGRWWRQGHAGGRRAGRLRGRARRCEARGGIGVRRRSGSPGALSGATTPYRGADLRRPARPDRAPVRARLLGAAASPEGDRGGAGTGPLARAAQHARHACDPGRPGGRLRQRRHRRVPDGRTAASTSSR